MNTTSSKVKYSSGDKLFYTIIFILVTVFLLAVLYPLIYIVSSSFSSANAVTTGKVILWPVDISFEGYKAVFENKDVWMGYKNTILYTILGTLINICMTLLAAYPLSRRDLVGRNAITFIFSFTMMFSGGIIPSYILMRDLKLLNTLWVMVIPGAISVYNMLVVKTFIQTSIPHELLEAAQIDGCNDFTYFFKMVIPLSKASIAVITLFYAVGHWNAYFNAFLYLENRQLFPLQLILREILITNKVSADVLMDPMSLEAKQGLADLLKYSLIIVSTVPILCVYPFVQKYFVKGMMVGSVKG